MNKLNILRSAFYNIDLNLDMFYYDNKDLIEVFEICDNTDKVEASQKESIEELLENLNDHIRFITEYNCSVGDFL